MTPERSALHLLTSLQLALLAIALVSVTIVAAMSGFVTEASAQFQLIGNGIWSN